MMMMPSTTRTRAVVLMQICICVALTVSSTSIAAQTSTTEIVSIYYQNGTCEGTSYNTTYNAGQCIIEGGEGFSYYCSADGSTAFMYRFTDPSCSLNSAYVVSEVQTTCGFEAKSVQWACINPSLGPAAPLVFPPVGWLQSSECVNASNSYKPASTCSSEGDPNIHCFDVAMEGGCRAYNFVGSKTYAQDGCNAEGTVAGTAIFTDAGCSTLVALETMPVGCYNGQSVACQGEPLPTLPPFGTIHFPDSDCTVVSGAAAPSTILFVPGVCVGSTMYQCEQVGGVLNGVLSTFNDPSHTGQCVGTAMNKTQIPGLCVDGTMFLCNTQDLQSDIAMW